MMAAVVVMTAATPTVVDDFSVDGLQNATVDGVTVGVVVVDSQPTTSPSVYVVCTMLLALTLLGTLGNGLVLYVFNKRRDRLVSTLYIQVLALVDLLASAILMPFTVYMEYYDFLVDSDIVCKIYMFLATSNIPFSALIMVAIAVDRYLCICHPFAGLMTIRRAKTLIAILSAIVVAIGVCVSLQFGTYAWKLHTESTAPLNVTVASSTTAVVGHSSLEDFVSSSAGYMTVETTSSGLLQTSTKSAVESWPGTDADLTSSDLLQSVVLSVENGSVVHTGLCQPTDLLISSEFQYYYQKFYTALYLVCLIVVTVLYVLIYESVVRRRTRRQREKCKGISASTAMSGVVAAGALYVQDGFRSMSPVPDDDMADLDDDSSQNRTPVAAVEAELTNCYILTAATPSPTDSTLLTVPMPHHCCTGNGSAPGGGENSPPMAVTTVFMTSDADRKGVSVNNNKNTGVDKSDSRQRQKLHRDGGEPVKHRLSLLPSPTKTRHASFAGFPAHDFRRPQSPCGSTEAVETGHRKSLNRFGRKRTSMTSVTPGKCNQSPRRRQSSALEMHTIDRRFTLLSRGRTSRAESIRSIKADAKVLANLRTAAMLFVVTLVFVVTFAPAFLMALRVVPYNMIVFYLYFANNVANPVIYSFMNKNFRDDLVKIFRSTKSLRRW